jgi:hypothetical protein
VRICIWPVQNCCAFVKTRAPSLWERHGAASPASVVLGRTYTNTKTLPMPLCYLRIWDLGPPQHAPVRETPHPPPNREEQLDHKTEAQSRLQQTVSNGPQNRRPLSGERRAASGERLAGLGEVMRGSPHHTGRSLCTRRFAHPKNRAPMRIAESTCAPPAALALSWAAAGGMAAGATAPCVWAPSSAAGLVQPTPFLPLCWTQGLLLVLRLAVGLWSDF